MTKLAYMDQQHACEFDAMTLTCCGIKDSETGQNWDVTLRINA